MKNGLVTGNLSEKQRIEHSTAEGFLDLFNAQTGSQYQVVHIAGPNEVPDVVAKDAAGNFLNIEVSMTEDHDGDVAALLGRSEHKSVEALKTHIEAVKSGAASISVNSLQDNAVEKLAERIDKKLCKDYGKNVALVIRETSIPWDWESVVPMIQTWLHGKRVPFDRGIWLLSRDRSRLTPIYP